MPSSAAAARHVARRGTARGAWGAAPAVRGPRRGAGGGRRDVGIGIARATEADRRAGWPLRAVRAGAAQASADRHAGAALGAAAGGRRAGAGCRRLGWSRWHHRPLAARVRRRGRLAGDRTGDAAPRRCGARRRGGPLGHAARGATVLPGGLAGRFAVKAELVPAVLRGLGFRVLPGGNLGPGGFGLPTPATLAPLKRRRMAPVELPDVSGPGPVAVLAALKR